MSKQANIKATLLLKVPGRPPVEVTTAVPTTLRKVSDSKMIGYCDSKETNVIANTTNKQRVVEAWNGWSKDQYEVVWSGASQEGLSKSKLPTQKGMLMPDVEMGSATKQIMEHMQLLDVDETKVDAQENIKKKKKATKKTT